MKNLVFYFLMLPVYCFGQLQPISTSSVLWYGTKGDGVTDDTAAIQRAITLNPNKEVFFPRGTYKVSSGIIITSPVKIYGKATLTYPADTTAFAMFVVTNAVNVSISDLVFDGNYYNQSVWSEYRHAIKIYGSTNVSISGCTFTNLIGDGIEMGESVYADPQTSSPHNIAVNGCTFAGKNVNRNGVSVLSAEKVRITDNTFDGMARSTMPGGVDLEPYHTNQFIRDVIISGNLFKNSMHSIQLAGVFTPGDISDVVISKNTFRHEPAGSEFSWAAVTIYGGQRVVIADNSISNHRTWAIKLEGATNVVVSANNIQSCNYGILSYTNRNISISGNILNGNTNGPIALQESPGTLVNGNIISSWAAGYGIGLTGDCASSTVTANIIDGVTGSLIGIQTGSSTNINLLANSIGRCSINISSAINSGLEPTSKGLLVAPSSSGDYGMVALRLVNGTSATPSIADVLGGQASATNYLPSIRYRNSWADNYASFMEFLTSGPASAASTNSLSLKYNSAEFFGNNLAISSAGNISRLNGNSVAILSGNGSPEGTITADQGSLYLRLDGGTGTTIYIKETGSYSNTGWAAK